ncbi:MAG: ribonuclease R [Enterobacter sp.]|nr:ribonuclease R [Enterobacter sp.]
MSHDPFQEREAEKYANPIPSREFIIEHLTKREKPANREELAVELNIEGEEQIEALRRRLRAMERDGQLVFTRRQCYALPERLDLLKGTVIGHRDGFGFLRVEGRKDDLYLSSDFDILIPPEEVMGARMGFVVVVELTQRPTRRTKAVGKIVEVLGDNMGTGMAVDMALRTHEIPYIWPKAVEEQIESLREEVPEESKVGRVDLRSLPLVTIDGEDARDFDDAVYCEKKRGGGWRLWVAIADVSYYVRPHTPLDNEARSRGTSVYFPSQVVPMLPEVLSNGLCSLNPQVDRLCMVCEMTISNKGRLTGYKFYEAVMSSHARLTYTKVWHMLQGDQDLREQYAPLVKHIEELHAKFIFNAERRIERIEQTQRNDAHKLIEECMILANISAARFVEKAKEPALFRIHDKPSTEAITAFRSVLAELGLELPGGNKPEPRDYAELLESISDRPDAEMLQTMLLRSMKQAIYDPENRGHFGLALQSYAHYTSPIRRYPDLSLHRAIKYLLAQEQGHKGNTTETTGGYHYSMEEMLQLGQHCSMTERRADEATRDVADWLKCDFMLDQVGNVFKGVIASVTGFGFFVRLDELFIDGLVHVSSLDNDYYRFDQVGQRLIGESGGQTYRLGDRVEVKVEAVNMDDRKIDFSLISSERAPRNVGKTERERAKKGGNGKTSGKRRQAGKKVNFEPDSAFRGEKKQKPKAAKKEARAAKKPSAKTQKIAAATKAKRAAKKKQAE